jgi:charged multivesicular body protein 4
MSGVWGWFGGQSAQKRKDTPKNAILGLRSQLEMLQKRERHLQNQMDEQDAIARKNVSTNKIGKCCQVFGSLATLPPSYFL